MWSCGSLILNAIQWTKVAKRPDGRRAPKDNGGTDRPDGQSSPPSNAAPNHEVQTVPRGRSLL